jgi:type IV secretory pathway VirB2 component (pilin)
VTDLPDNTTPAEAVDVVDWWASRVVDREVEFADVPSELRADVQARAADFDSIRRGLLATGVGDAADEMAISRAIREASTAPSAHADRASIKRIIGPLAMAAALVAVVAIGVSIVGRDSSSSDDFASTAAEVSAPTTRTKSTESVADTAMAIESAGAVAVAPMNDGSAVRIADMVELGEVTSGWWANPPATKDSGTCPVMDAMRVVDIEIVFAGMPAEIHLGPDSLKVLALADCMVLAGITA